MIHLGEYIHRAIVELLQQGASLDTLVTVSVHERHFPTGRRVYCTVAGHTTTGRIIATSYLKEGNYE